MRRGVATAAVLLAAALLPLAATLAVTAHLLDPVAASPPALVELLVHGHPHGGRVPDHEHVASRGPARPRRVERATDLPAVPASGTRAPLASPARAPSADDPGACRPHRPSTLRPHLALGVLLI